MKRPLLLILGILCTLFGLAIPLTTAVITFLLPETFAATARVTHATNNPATLLNEVRSFTSAAALDSIISDLNLREQWGRKYKQPGPLSVERGRAILLGNITLSQARSSRFVDIRVFSDNKDEAAVIANKIASAYAAGTPGASIVEQAQANPVPVRPNKRRNILLGLLAGANFIVIGVCLLVAARRRGAVASAG